MFPLLDLLDSNNLALMSDAYTAAHIKILTRHKKCRRRRRTPRTIDTRLNEPRKRRRPMGNENGSYILQGGTVRAGNSFIKDG